MRTAAHLAVLGALASLGACTNTGQERITYPAQAVGVAPVPFVVGDWTVTLDRADLAFGPAYFCSNEAASFNLCGAAVQEFLDVAVIDGLDPTPQNLGLIDGVTGTIGSVTYDLGITWLLTESKPRVRSDTGHSLVAEGTAVSGNRSVHFVADIDLPPMFQGSDLVDGQKASIDIEDDRWRLEVGIDPTTWWTQVDFDALSVVRADPVAIVAGTRSYNALEIAVTANIPPTFAWKESQ